MLNKYYIGDKIYFLNPHLQDYVTGMYSYNERYSDCEIEESWMSRDDEYKTLITDIYFEVRSRIEHKIDYYKLKMETAKVVDYLCRRFRSERKNVIITFNGEDGFYLRMHGFVIILLPGATLRNTVRLIAEEIKEELEIDTLMFDIYETDSSHVIFGIMKNKTELYLNEISYEMLMDYSYGEIIDYCSVKHEERYSVFPEDTDEIKKTMEKIIAENVSDDSESDLEEWLKGYKPYKMLTYQQYVDKFAYACKDDGELMDIVGFCMFKFDDLMKNFNDIADEEKDKAFADIIYDVADFFIFLLGRKTKAIDTTKCEEENIILIHRGSLYENAIACMSHYFIGNEDFYYQFNSMKKKYSKEEMFTVISMLYVHIIDYLEEHFKVIK